MEAKRTPNKISSDGKESMPPKEPNFTHRGIEINGINFLEENGILNRQDVTDLIDKLPKGYFTNIPLGTINFMPYGFYSVERDGKVIYLKEDDVKPSDKIIARKRAVTGWNNKMTDDGAIPTDGKMTIDIFSPLNWDGKNDRQLDKQVTLYSLSHEIGHTIFGTAIYGPGIFSEFKKLGIALPCSENAVDYLPLIEKWKKMPESMMQRYREYKDVFTKEHKRDSTGHLERSLEELSREEDFAISFENYLYWGNLQQIDPQRFEIQDSIIQILDV